jgi:hypothetical protein
MTCERRWRLAPHLPAAGRSSIWPIRNDVIRAHAEKLKGLVCVYGHDLLVEDAIGSEYAEASETDLAHPRG